MLVHTSIQYNKVRFQRSLFDWIAAGVYARRARNDGEGVIGLFRDVKA